MTDNDWGKLLPQLIEVAWEEGYQVGREEAESEQND